MSSTFEPPPWTMGQGRSFALTASAVASRESRWSCPAKISLGARMQAGSLQPRGDRWRRTWDDAGRLWFGLMDGLEGKEPDVRLTFTQRAFVAHAVEQVGDLEDLSSVSAGVSMTLTGNVENSGEDHRIYTSGPQLRSADGAVWEAVRLRYRSVRGPESDEAQDFIATAANVLVHGSTAARLRISEISLDDGTYAVLFDGTREEALELYRERGRPVQLALESQELRPGSSCADCSFLAVCPGPQRVRGALGLPGRAVATRAISATDLQIYAFCPTRYQALRRDHLPERFGPEGPGSGGAQSRGLAIHSWLRWAHSRGQGCTAEDLDGPGESGLTAEAFALAHPWLEQHLEHCLLGYDGLTDAQVEPLHVVHDPDADCVVVTSPDLTLRMSPGAPVWRETKTVSGSLPVDVEDALERYPGGFALSVALIAAGLDGAARDEGSVELEVLSPTASAVFVVPMSDGGLVALAQQRVAEIAWAWARDLRFERKPSRGCASCGAFGWCDPPELDARPAVAVDDREFLGLPDPF